MADEQTDKDTTPPDDKSTETEEWKPPTKDEHEKIQRALAKANAEAKTHREKLRELQTKTEGDAEKAAREQAEAAEKKYKPLAVRSAAKAAFLEAGLQGSSPERVTKLVRMLDLDAITVDDDGDVVGLEDQVKSIKADYPELFATQDKRPPRVSGADKPPANGRVLSTGEKIAAQLFGR